AYRFAKARGETAFFFKTPPDTLWHWRRLLSALKPDVLLVVRHELWPAFLYQSRRMEKRLLLIDATETPSLSKRTMAKIAKTTLLRFFDGIYVVSPKDAQFYQHELGVPKAV